MKRLLIQFLLLSLCMVMQSQSYKMVITQTNGVIQEIPADLVEQVSFVEVKTYSIEWGLQNVTASETPTTIAQDMPLNIQLIPDEGYYISNVNVTIDIEYFYTEDITSRVYSNGYINIDQVYGNLSITASAEKISNGIDLSSQGTANCYVVTDAGRYKFSTGSYSGNQAFLLWNEFGENDIVDVELQGDYIYFTKNEFKKGNAVISLKDEDNIVWSWHIWSTDQPQYISVENLDYCVILDRNLGATETTPGSLDVYGLRYIPGSPFPFPGPKYSDFVVTNEPSVPNGWYVADGYGFYTSTEMPGPDKPMQICTHNDKFGNSVFFQFKSEYVPGPFNNYVLSGHPFQAVVGYEPHIEDGGVWANDNLFIPCNSPALNYGKYLGWDRYNTSAVDTYTFYFYEGVSKTSDYCQGAVLLPIRTLKYTW